MAQKSTESVPLAKERMPSYGALGTTQPSPTLTPKELRAESMNIVMRISDRRKSDDLFPLFHAIRFEPQLVFAGCWGLVTSEKDFYGSFSTHLVVERERVPQENFAFVFGDAHPVYLRHLYAILLLLWENKYVYYMEKRVEICALKATGEALDDKTDAALGPLVSFF